MADNIVGGLFGVDPAQLQQQRMAQDLKEGFMLAQLSPMERATAGIYAGSKQLGRAGQSLLGMEDPQLQEAAMAKKLSENFDVNSVSGLRGLAAELQKAGSLRYSQLAAQQANQLEASAITRGLNLRKTETEGNQLAWIGVDGQPDMKQQAVVDKATGAIIRRVGDPISVVTSRATSTVN